MTEKSKSITPMRHFNMADFLRGQASRILTSVSETDDTVFRLQTWKVHRGCHVK